MMKYLLVAIAFIGICYSSETHIISDYNFTNQDYTFQEYRNFYTNFPNCKLNYAQKEIIYRASRIFELNYMVVMAKMQNETDLIMNYGKDHRYNWRVHRAMGYGLIRHWWETNQNTGKRYKFYKYGGFDIQVYKACELLRKSFDKHKKGVTIKLLDSGKIIVPENASTYSIYVYNPFYGKHSSYGYGSTGNLLFEKYYSQLKKIKK